MGAALALLMTSGAAFAASNDLPEPPFRRAEPITPADQAQFDFISDTVKALVAVKQCGLTLNTPVVYDAMLRVGLEVSDLRDGGRFSKYFREMISAVLADLADVRRDMAIPQDVLCAGWSVGFGADAPIASRRNWLR